MRKKTGKKALFEGAGTEAIQEAFGKWVGENLDGVIHYGNGVAGADGRTVRMVTTPGYTIPVLIYLKFAPNKQEPEAEAYAFYLKGRWFDLSELTAKDASGELEKYVEETMNAMLEDEASWFFEIKAGQENKIPAEGLEKVQIMEGSLFADMMEAASEGMSEEGSEASETAEASEASETSETSETAAEKETERITG